VGQDLPQPFGPLGVGMAAELVALLVGLQERLLHHVGRVELAAQPRVEVQPVEVKGLVPGRSAELRLNGQRWGLFGELDRTSPEAAALKLRDAVTVAEVSLAPIIEAAVLVVNNWLQLEKKMVTV